jgi:KaiC/GvpD/RAD55 family RecA-like ATPase
VSAEPEREPGETWRPLDLSDVLAGSYEPPAADVLTRSDGAHLLYAGKLNTIVGEPESGKTWLAVVAAHQAITAGRSVAWIDIEDDARTLVGRLRAMAVSADAIRSHLLYVRPHEALGFHGRQQVAAWLSAHAPSLVVIDSVSELMSLHELDPKSDIDVVLMHQLARTFATAGAAVVLIDHVTKATEGRGRWATGSERKVSGIDGVALNVHRLAPFAPGKTGRLRLTVGKDRPGGVRSISTGRDHDQAAVVELRSWPDGGVMYSVDPCPSYDASSPFRPTELMERVSKVIEAQPGMSANLLRQTVSGKTDSIAAALELLVADGYISVTKGPRNASEHRSIRPFRNAPDDLEALP